MATVIIGTGLAGYNLAKELRKGGYEGALTLITSDDGSCYSKPMLSNGLAKEKTPDQMIMMSADAMAAQLNAEIKSETPVTAINRLDKTVQLGTELLSYERLVLAAGALPRTLPFLETAALPGLFSINSLADYRQFRSFMDQRLDEARAREGRVRVALIGGGLVGCELANDVMALGAEEVEVTLIEPMGRCLPTLLPEAVAQALGTGLAEAGVRLVFESVTGLEVAELEEGQQGLLAVLASGESQLFDAVISAIGMVPNVSLAEAAGLEVARGIVVNKHLQTSDPSIYALGDCAEVAGQLLFYILPLMACVRVLSKRLLGDDAAQVEYGAMPVAVKTPACPLVIAPVPEGVEGTWVFEYGEAAIDCKATFVDQSDRLQGFALSGSYIGEKNTLKKEWVLRA